MRIARDISTSSFSSLIDEYVETENELSYESDSESSILSTPYEITDSDIDLVPPCLKHLLEEDTDIFWNNEYESTYYNFHIVADHCDTQIGRSSNMVTTSALREYMSQSVSNNRHYYNSSQQPSNWYRQSEEQLSLHIHKDTLNFYNKIMPTVDTLLEAHHVWKTDDMSEKSIEHKNEFIYYYQSLLPIVRSLVLQTTDWIDKERDRVVRSGLSLSSYYDVYDKIRAELNLENRTDFSSLHCSEIHSKVAYSSILERELEQVFVLLCYLEYLLFIQCREVSASEASLELDIFFKLQTEVIQSVQNLFGQKFGRILQ